MMSSSIPLHLCYSKGVLRKGKHWFWRLVRITLGLVLLLAGLILSLPGIPGPGIVLVVLSLSLLSTDFGWAARLKRQLEHLWQKARKKKQQPENGEEVPK